MGIIKKLVAANKALQAKFDYKFPSLSKRESYYDELQERIRQDISSGVNLSVLEVGGVDRPLLEKSPNYTYIGVDIDEKPAGKEVYDSFIAQSIELPLPIKVDLIISKTLLEHVPDNAASVRVMYESLNFGGSTHHYVPSKWHPYSICLRLVGHRLQNVLIRLLRPEAAGVTGYPAFFNKCTSESMSENFKAAGFTRIDLIPYYQASAYFAFFFPFYFAVLMFENLCRKFDWRIFASGFIISAKKI